MPDSAPNLEGFESVLELLAKHTKSLTGSAYTEEWVRGSIVAAGTKLRALKFILTRNQPRKPASLLDLGAQIGSFAIYAARLGLQVAAIDYPYFFHPYGGFASQQGVDYRACDVSQEPLPFSDQSFDFVTYMDVIEHHAYSPKRVLLEVFRVLKPGGFVIVTTPNHASIYNRIALLMGKSVNDPFPVFFEVPGQNGVYPGHHREYTRVELRAALERTGFHVTECRAIEEDLQPEWHLIRQTSGNSTLRSVWERRNVLAAMVLGKVWETVALPFGRVLWAVGEKRNA